jgi:translation initiation factor IF-1
MHLHIGAKVTRLGEFGHMSIYCYCKVTEIAHISGLLKSMVKAMH